MDYLVVISVLLISMSHVVDLRHVKEPYTAWVRCFVGQISWPVSHPWYSPASLPEGSGCWIRLIRKPVLWQQVSHLLHKYTESGYETVLTSACARQGCSTKEWVSESPVTVWRTKSPPLHSSTSSHSVAENPCASFVIVVDVDVRPDRSRPATVTRPFENMWAHTLSHKTRCDEAQQPRHVGSAANCSIWHGFTSQKPITALRSCGALLNQNGLADVRGARQLTAKVTHRNDWVTPRLWSWSCAHREYSSLSHTSYTCQKRLIFWVCLTTCKTSQMFTKSPIQTIWRALLQSLSSRTNFIMRSILRTTNSRGHWNQDEVAVPQEVSWVSAVHVTSLTVPTSTHTHTHLCYWPSVTFFRKWYRCSTKFITMSESVVTPRTSERHQN
jgi:hypothetical protein